MKVLGKTAIHDLGFQFYLTLGIEYCLESLVRDIHTLEECIKTHKKWKEEPWYRSKTEVHLFSSIEGYSKRHFTLTECQKAYTEKRYKYDLLISLSEKALDKINNDSNILEHHRPYYLDLERSNIIVEENVCEGEK